MLDAESAIFTVVANDLRARFDGISVYGEEVESPASFPCVTLVQTDNATYKRTMTAENTENHVSAVFVANAYSNSLPLGKQQCKDIIAAIDEILRGLGFVRTLSEPIPNYERTIRRRVARWNGIVGADGYIYKS